MSKIVMLLYRIALLITILVLMEERYILVAPQLRIETLHSLILLLTIIVQQLKVEHCIMTLSDQA